MLLEFFLLFNFVVYIEFFLFDLILCFFFLIGFVVFGRGVELIVLKFDLEFFFDRFDSCWKKFILGVGK